MEFNVVTPIEGPPGKTRWHRIGRAWSDGTKITVVLDSIPFRSEFIYLFQKDEDKEKSK